MITIHKINDPLYVKELLQRDSLYQDIWPTITDLTLMVPDMQSIAWFEVTKYYATIGILFIKEHTDNCVYFHGGMFKEYRNINTVNILKDCLTQLHILLPGYVFATTINSKNIPAINLIKKIGCVHQGTIKNGYKTGDLMIFSEVE